MKHNLSLTHEILPPLTEPADGKAPLLIMLHGYGSNEQDLYGMAPLLNEKFFVISLRAPLVLPWGGYAWYELDYNKGRSEMGNGEQAEQSLGKLQEFVEEAKNAYPVDPDNIWLMGFSQGCILSLLLAGKNPENYRGVIGMSGYLWNEKMEKDIDWKAFGELSFFISHGVMDDVIPVDWARQSYEVLKKKGIDVQLREYPMPHGINQQCFDDLKMWLKEQGFGSGSS